MLKEQIQKDMISAMKNKEELKVSVLRMIKSAILKYEVSGERKEATDEDILKIIKKELKQRKDSIKQYIEGGRDELAKKEEEEAKILSTYLPAELTEAEIEKIVKEVIEETGATNKSDIGKVMGLSMKKTKGQADGNNVKKIVEKLLS